VLVQHPLLRFIHFDFVKREKMNKINLTRRRYYTWMHLGALVMITLPGVSVRRKYFAGK
jgi:hypothetical protein